MKLNTIKYLIILYNILNSSMSYAGLDPVAWKLIPSLNSVNINAGASTSAVYTLTNNISRPVTIQTMITSSGRSFNFQDQCNQKTLNPGSSCNVSLFFTPTTAGKASFQLSYKYNNNVIMLPPWTGTASQSQHLLNGTINFPSSIVLDTNKTTNFSILYANDGANTLTDCFLGDASGNNKLVLKPNSTGDGLLQLTSSTCGTINNTVSISGGSLGNNHCVVDAKFTPSTAGAITIGSLMTCKTASSSPTANSNIISPNYGLTGNFARPNPFPSTFYTNQSPTVLALFTNTGSIDLTNCKASISISPTSAATVNISDTTCGTSSSPVTINKDSKPCTITGELTSLQETVSSVTLTATVQCDNKISNASKSFNIAENSGSCSTLSINPTLPLPTATYLYADNMVKFQIENTCASDTVSLDDINISAILGSATITGINKTYDNCSHQSLAPSDSCDVMVSVIPNQTGSLKIEASPSNYLTQKGETDTTVSTNQQTKHHVLFVNQCPFDVWYGIANGDSSDCPGISCKSPDPNGTSPVSSYHLPAQVMANPPSTIDLEISNYQNGAFWPRTGCKMQNGQFNCITGTCRTISNSATCVSSGALMQPQSPYTKFEANLLSTAGQDGVYDVSIINGMTVPVEVKGLGPSTGNSASTVYNCAGAGALLQPESNNLLGNCSWDLNPQSTIPISSINNDFYWVTPGADSACTNEANCGMSYNNYPSATDGNSPAPINRRIGNFLGFSTLTNYSAYIQPSQWGTSNLFSKYGMDKQIPNQTTGLNYGTTVGGASIVLNSSSYPNSKYNNTYPAYNTLLSIPGITNNGSLGSCYTLTNSYFAHCGGCINWGITEPSQQCGDGSTNYKDNWNLDWTTNKIPAPIGNYSPLQAIKWLKNACPTAYAYQFDDPSSSFQCTKDGSTELLTSYQVTFCPGGLTSLPSNATEGRSTPPV